MTPPGLSIVVPAYDEEQNLPLLAQELRDELAKAGIASYEVIFVDDGSRDDTAARAQLEATRDPEHFRLLRLAQNSGESAATEAGLRAALGAVCVVMDCDLQNPPADIPQLLAPIERGEADCVQGWRRGRADGDDAWRRLQSRVANAIRDVVTGDRVRDAGCTFRAFRRECVERVKLHRGMHRFLPTLIRFEGYRVVEVPVGHRPRRHGRSKYGAWNRALPALIDAVAVRWMRSRTTPWR